MHDNSLRGHATQPIPSSSKHWTVRLTFACMVVFLLLVVILCIPLPYPPSATTAWLYESRPLNLFAVILLPGLLCLLSGFALYKARAPQWRSGASVAQIGLLVGLMGIILDIVLFILILQFISTPD